MLKGENLGYRYGSKQPWILRNYSLTLSPGQRLGLYGPSGYGKTTLAKLLAGYLTPMEGLITLDGTPLPTQGYSPIQLIFQNPELAVNPRWRIHQVLSEAGNPNLVSASSDLSQQLQLLSIDPSWLNRWPHELSGGELQRIAVARALGSRTRYLICDEMTAMLDANTQALIWQAVLTVTQQRQLGLLVISHNHDLLERVCDQILDLTLTVPIKMKSKTL